MRAITVIALRVHIRTLLEGNIDTLAKVVKFIPALPHPILQHTPPTLNFVQVWRIGLYADIHAFIGTWHSQG